MADYIPSNAFIFGDDNYTPGPAFDITIVAGEPTGSFDVTLEGPTSEIIAANILNLGVMSAQLDNCVASLFGEYDPNVNRNFRTYCFNSTHEDTTYLAPASTCFPVEQAEQLSHEGQSDQVDGQFLFDCTTIANLAGTPLELAKCFTYEQGERVEGKVCFVREQGTRIDIERCFSYEEGTYLAASGCFVMEQMTKVYPYRWEFPYQDAGNVQHDFLHPVFLTPLPPHDFTPDAQITFNGDEYTPTEHFEFLYGRPSNIQVRHTWGITTNIYNSSFGYASFIDVKRCSVVEEARRPPNGVTIWVDNPRPDPDPNPPSGDTIIVPVQEVYTMINIILVTLDDDVTPIQLKDISLSLDADSYTWQFGADLIDPAEITLIKQLPDGTAKILHVVINNYTWHVLVEKIAINRVFGNQSVKISGRGLTALLSKPYEQPVSVNVGTTTDIRVIVDDILPLGWNELGDLYWQLGDNPTSSPVFWTVDAGAYSYQNKTTIEALGDLSKDIGVMLVPSRDSQEIYFKSRYPVLPWNFDLVNVDIAIPDSAVIQLSEEPVSSFQANAVYVHGNEIGGELAFVRLNGTAGDRLAPTVNNSLLTDVVALRSLGERILSGQYAQPKIKSFTTFMDGTIVPLIEIGDFVGVTVDGVETRGIANAVSIVANHGEVTQSITIGEATPNTWVAFKEILPKDPMLVATLASTDGLTSLVTLIDGGVVRVRGTGNTGSKYYVRSGEIVSDAPNLIQSEIVL